MKKHIFVFGIISALLVFGLVLTGCDTTTGTFSTGWGVPSAPTNLRVTGTTSNTVSLAWNAVSNANGYYIYYSSNAYGSYTKMTNSTSDNYATITGVAPNTDWYYKVSAYNSNGEGNQSSYVQARITTGGGAPGTPTGVRASVANTEITVTWDSVLGATGYRLEYRKGSSGSWAQLVSSSTGGNFIGTGAIHGNDEGKTGALDSGYTYYYRVRAVNSTGESGWSTIVNATTTTYNNPYLLTSNTYLYNSLSPGDYIHYYMFNATTTGWYNIEWMDWDYPKTGSPLSEPRADILVAVWDHWDNNLVPIGKIDTGTEGDNMHTFQIFSPQTVYILVIPYDEDEEGSYAIKWW